MKSKVWLVYVPLWVPQVIPDELGSNCFVIAELIMLFDAEEALELPQSYSRAILAVK